MFSCPGIDLWFVGDATCCHLDHIDRLAIGPRGVLRHTAGISYCHCRKMYAFRDIERAEANAHTALKEFHPKPAAIIGGSSRLGRYKPLAIARESPCFAPAALNGGIHRS